MTEELNFTERVTGENETSQPFSTPLEYRHGRV